MDPSASGVYRVVFRRCAKTAEGSGLRAPHTHHALMSRSPGNAGSTQRSMMPAILRRLHTQINSSVDIGPDGEMIWLVPHG